jgi:hypothetical protein
MYISHKTRGREKLRNSHEHTLWKAIETYDRNIAGTYFDAIDIDPVTGFVDIKPYEIIVPHTAFLEFQKFELYPRWILGNVEIKVKASRQGLVIAQVPFEATYNEFAQGVVTPLTFEGIFGAVAHTARVVPKRDFTQLGNRFMCCIGWTKSGETNNFQWGYMTAYNESSECELRTVVYGFKIAPEVRAQIEAQFQGTTWIPAQSFQFETLDKVDANEPVDKTITLKTNYVELFDVLFPKHGNEYTVFENPCLKNFQCQLDNNINYPEEKTTTFSPKLLTMVKNSAEIGPLQLTHDLIASYVEPRNRLDGTPIYNTRYACSDFSIPIDLQRNHNEGAFDGYVSDHNLM